MTNLRFLSFNKLHKCGNFGVQYPHCTQKVNAICAKIGICVRIFHICTIHKIRCRCHRSRQTHTIVTYVYKYIRSLSIIEKPAKPIGSIEAIVSTSIVPTCSCLQLCSTVLHTLIQQIQLNSLCIIKCYLKHLSVKYYNVCPLGMRNQNFINFRTSFINAKFSYIFTMNIF